MKRGRAADTPLPSDGSTQGDLFSGRAPVAHGPVPPSAPEQRAPPAPPSAPPPWEVRLPDPMRPPPGPTPRPWEVASAAQAAPRSVAPVVYSVGELTRAIKATLEGEFPRVTVRGELSGYRGPNARGHLYFSLKDAEACLDTKVWASTAQKLKFRLKDGMEVVAEGYLDLYAPQGRYSLIVQRLEPVGEGALALAFLQLKERLTAEGLMGENRRRAPRPLPLLPRRIGVVTSITGAALQDFLRVLHGRHPGLPVLVAHARVQGDGAAQEVVRALERLARTDVDVVVVTRGGGSVEDLWTFNEEAVARAIHACPVPVVSAIGHEVDFTIADFVADVRAPTPSAAAERLAPVRRELLLWLATQQGRLVKAQERHRLSARQDLLTLSGRLPDPRRALGQATLRLNGQSEALASALRVRLKAEHVALKALAERLGRQQPRARLLENRRDLQKLKERLVALGLGRLKAEGAALARARLSLERQSPARRIRLEGEALTALHTRLGEHVRRRQGDAKRRLLELSSRMDAMSPLRVMARGYAVAFREADGQLVRSARDVSVGARLTLKLAPHGAQSLADCEEVDTTVVALRRPGERP